MKDKEKREEKEMVRRIVWIAVVLVVGGFIIYSCGKAIQEAVTPAPTVTVSTITGKVLVPSASIAGTGIRISAVEKQSVAEDGVSNIPLEGGQVALCDALTKQQLTGTTTPAVDANGDFSLSISGVTLSEETLLRVTKTSADKTTLVQALYSKDDLTTGTSADANYGTTLGTNKMYDEASEKAGDLLGKASSLSASDKASLMAKMVAMYKKVKESMGTISLSNVTSLALTNTGKTISQLEKEMFERLTDEVSAEFTTPPSGWDTDLSAFQSGITSLVTGATYPSGLQLPTGYASFTLPEGMSLPSGTKFGYSPMGASFLPSYYFDKMPSGAYLGSGFSLPSGGLVSLPRGVSFGSGFNLASGYETKLPSGMYFESGCDVPSGTIIPKGANFETGFDFDQNWTDISFGSGFVMPSYVELKSGFVVPTGISFASGTPVYSGVSFASGVIVPDEVILKSGFVISSGMQFESGIKIYSGVSFASGVPIQNEILLQSGYVVSSGMQFESGVSIYSGVSFASGITIPDEVKLQSGYVISSGMQFENPSYSIQSGVQQSGWTLPSGYSGYIPSQAPTGM